MYYVNYFVKIRYTLLWILPILQLYTKTAYTSKRYYLKGDYSNEKDIQNAFCISHRNDLPRNRWNHDMVRAHICGS